jgi:transcriptional regulator with XRE-family HTH domain
LTNVYAGYIVAVYEEEKTMAFADNLRKLRAERGWGKVEAASKLVMAYQQYEALERDGSNPTLKTIEKVAKGFGVSKKSLVE